MQVVRRPRLRLARTDAGWHWTLIAPNGEVVAVSESYTTRLAARKGIADA